MAAASLDGLVFDGSYCTSADPTATFALLTPSVFVRVALTRRTHASQCIPSIFSAVLLIVFSSFLLLLKSTPWPEGRAHLQTHSLRPSYSLRNASLRWWT